ncbi:3'(2'),5'-bisphosphate nucleotidase 1-like [Anneissia japonica]|uniref:3'(2'),5'-bisphosphate nucleotidase 1-like n=1 Tax=Anneissia japonica TaxID=1529436 RepID=UPI00142590C2|nr:3'(2'),5'-bisphosphate nucleotidase 1-like [Anneissia japonica]
MASNSCLVMRLVSASVSVAKRAGTIVRDIRSKGSLGVVEKTGKNDLQTEADRKAQRCIVASLTRRFAGIIVIGEEELPKEEEIDENLIENGYSEEVDESECPEALKDVNIEDVVIWVDPLDGTKEFTEGTKYLDHVTVLIGVAVNGKPVGGVIHQPFYKFDTDSQTYVGRTMWGVVGLGAFGFKHEDQTQGKRILTTTRSHGTEAVQETLRAMEPDEVLRVGGAGHKVLLVLEGRVSAYIFASMGCKKWDTCAPEALLVAVGGKLTDVHGNVYRYDKDITHMNTGGVVAAYRKHEFYIERVPQSIKDVLPTQ